MGWEIIGLLALAALAIYLWLKYENEKAMPKDNQRRVFTRDEVIKTAWQHYKKHGANCAHCSSDEDLDVDHIVPLSRGGHNGLKNRQVLCSRCNSKKGNRYSG